MKKATHDETSAFLPPSRVEANAMFTDRTVITERSFSLLVRAKRQGRWWVLKGLKPEYREQTVYRLLLRKEYDLMSQLSHQNIVMVDSIEEVGGLGLCIVMEWIDGANLSEWLADGKHTKQQRLGVARQLFDALAYIHSHQIVHRDLKPSNIMITANGSVVKLIDFGLGDADSYAIFKQPAGSDGYLSPEQLAGCKPDSRNDIYSLGCVLADLRLGWPSLFVVRRCKQPIEKRYHDVSEVRRALNRSSRVHYYIMVFALALSLALGYILRPSTEPTQSVATKLNTQNSTLKTQDVGDSIKLETPKPKLKTQQSPTATTQKSKLETQNSILEAAITDGKILVDSRIAQYDKEIGQRADTLTSQRYIEAYLQMAITDINTFVADYANSYKAKLTTEHAEQEINGKLLLYVNERYYQPWIARLKDIPQR